MGNSEYRFLTHNTEKGVIVLALNEPILHEDAMKEVFTVVNTLKSWRVVLNWQHVDYLVSAALSRLINLKKHLIQEGGLLVLCNMCSEVAEIFCVASLVQPFEIKSDIISAIACMKGKTETQTHGYSHTQTAPLSLILCGCALACIALGWIIGETPGMYVPGGVGLLIGLLALCFHHLTVQDRGEVLVIRFGPIPLFRRTVRYADIESVEVGRTLILDGWGIHMSIRGGWVWNLWGRDCAVIHFKKGVLRIGTDDAENLARFLEEKISELKT